MAPETITVNGVSLDQLVSNVSSLAGLLRTPQRRNELVVIPNAHGRVGRAVPMFDAGEITLPMWVAGVDPGTGELLYGEAGLTAYYAAADELARLFHEVPLTIEHTLPDGSVRVAVAQLVDQPIDFTRQLGSPVFGRFTATLAVPGAFWQDEDPVASGPHTGATGLEVNLSEFAHATAPMDELVITAGACNNPTWVQDSTGLFVAYDGVIGVGQKLVIDTSTWRLNQVAGHPDIPGSTVWAADLRKVRYHPDIGRWWQLTPETGGPNITFTHTGGGTASFAISGHPKHLIG